MLENEPLAVYIHFPYCKSRCPYCDFFRKLKPREFDENVWVERIFDDMQYFADFLGKRSVKSIFFGGGTPSILSADAISKVIERVKNSFDVFDNAEISIEANPNSFEIEKFRGFKKAGVNRLSLGVQALNEYDLKFLGRTHSVDEALKAMEVGVELFDKFSIDLMYARPKQNWDDWQKEIDMALNYGMKHISLYQLTIEEGTIFYKKNVQALDEEKSLTLYKDTVSYLREKGFERYEVSNFAKDDENRSVHNMVYWQGGDYIGLGEGAHGRFVKDEKIYATVDGKIDDILTKEERAEELVLMGLRIKDGINADCFEEKCGINLFNFVNDMSKKELANLKLLCYDARNIKLTDEGFLLLDKVILDLIS